MKYKNKNFVHQFDAKYISTKFKNEVSFLKFWSEVKSEATKTNFSGDPTTRDGWINTKKGALIPDIKNLEVILYINQ